VAFEVVASEVLLFKKPVLAVMECEEVTSAEAVSGRVMFEQVSFEEAVLELELAEFEKVGSEKAVSEVDAEEEAGFGAVDFEEAVFGKADFEQVQSEAVELHHAVPGAPPLPPFWNSRPA
jgi:hypothetical protein